MKNKPLSLNIIAVGYLITPLLNIFQTAWINHWPFQGPRSVFHHFSNYELITMACFPLVSFGIFRVAKWGYYSFLGFSLVILAHSIIFFVKSPIQSIYVTLLFDLVTIGLVGFFLQRHIMAPYFNPDMRWWEHDTRYKVNLGAHLRNKRQSWECDVLDISMRGCFVSLPQSFSVRDLVWIDVNINNLTLTTLAKVVWICPSRPEGYGLMFLGLENEEKKALKKILAYLRSSSDKGLEESKGTKAA